MSVVAVGAKAVATLSSINRVTRKINNEVTKVCQQVDGITDMTGEYLAKAKKLSDKITQICNIYRKGQTQLKPFIDNKVPAAIRAAALAVMNVFEDACKANEILKPAISRASTKLNNAQIKAAVNKVCAVNKKITLVLQRLPGGP